MAEQIRFGIIGCGVIGATHARAISSVPDAQLIAVADVIAERAQQLATSYGVTPYAAVQEMLEHEQLDVVDVCTPSGQHGETARQVMRTGRHVVVEKPSASRWRRERGSSSRLLSGIVRSFPYASGARKMSAQ